MRTVENIVRLREEEIRLKSKEEMRKIIEEKEEEEKIQFEKLRKELDNLVSKSDEQTETLNMVVDNYENLQEAWTQLFTLAGILLRYVPPQVRNELTDEYITDKRTKRVLQQSIDLTKNQWMYSDLIPAGIGYPGEYLDTKPVIPTKGISFSSANDKK